jgi:hypothetical protein
VVVSWAHLYGEKWDAVGESWVDQEILGCVCKV